MKNAESRRTTDLAMIHMAKKSLGLTDADYRALLAKTTGKTSAKELDWQGLRKVKQAFIDLGFKVKHKTHPRAPVTMDLSPHAIKARAIWIQLHSLGIVRDASEQALRAYGKRICKIDALQWNDGAKMDLLIETLKKWAERVLPGLIVKMYAQAAIDIAAMPPEHIERANELRAELSVLHAQFTAGLSSYYYRLAVYDHIRAVSFKTLER